MLSDKEFFAQFKQSSANKVRGFCFTFNNPTEKDVESLKALHCQYLVFGREHAPTTGTVHLQGFVYFTNPRAVKGVGSLYGWGVFPCRGAPSENVIYCGKEDENKFEKGDRPLDSETAIAQEKEKWKRIRVAAEEGRFGDIPDVEFIRYQHSLKRIRRDALPPAVDLDRAPYYGVWIYGPPGTGKSHYVRTTYPDVYMKELNKWWCGYHGEEYVCLDEYCPEVSVYLTSFMKKWVDRWTFRAEYKGGSFVIRPKLILVTSNYAIEECFTGVDCDAIIRRFQVIKMDKRN